MSLVPATGTPFVNRFVMHRAQGGLALGPTNNDFSTLDTTGHPSSWTLTSGAWAEITLRSEASGGSYLEIADGGISLQSSDLLPVYQTDVLILNAGMRASASGTHSVTLRGDFFGAPDAGVLSSGQATCLTLTFMQDCETDLDAPNQAIKVPQGARYVRLRINAAASGGTTEVHHPSVLLHKDFY
jgi:hypothetical protein